MSITVITQNYQLLICLWLILYYDLKTEFMVCLRVDLRVGYRPLSSSFFPLLGLEFWISNWEVPPRGGFSNGTLDPRMQWTNNKHISWHIALTSILTNENKSCFSHRHANPTSCCIGADGNHLLFISVFFSGDVIQPPYKLHITNSWLIIYLGESAVEICWNHHNNILTIYLQWQSI